MNLPSLSTLTSYSSSLVFGTEAVQKTRSYYWDRSLEAKPADGRIFSYLSTNLQRARDFSAVLLLSIPLINALAELALRINKAPPSQPKSLDERVVIELDYAKYPSGENDEEDVYYIRAKVKPGTNPGHLGTKKMGFTFCIDVSGTMRIKNRLGSVQNANGFFFDYQQKVKGGDGVNLPL